MSLDKATPPEDKTPGYKPDPLGSKNTRRWDGQKWTNEVLPPKGGGMGPGMKWLLGIGCSLVVLVVIGAAIGEDEDKSDEPAKEKSSTVAEDTSPPPATEPDQGADADAVSKPESEPKDPVEKPKAEKPEPVDPSTEVADALEDVPDSIYDVNVKDVYMLGNTVMVDLETPEGGLEGASTYDLNNMTAAVYRRIFTETDLQQPVLITYRGGLINSKTGADLPDAATAVYVIRKPEIRQIDWDDEDTVMYGGIDWSLYRTMLHPAIKDDD